MKKTTAQKERILTGEKILSSAWPAFEEKLAKVLQEMQEDEYLIISKKGEHSFVQFAAQGAAFGCRIETLSNFYRAENNQLSEAQITALLNMGWNPPTNDPESSTSENDPDGSPNYFLEFPVPLDVGGLTGLTVRTLTEILSVGHPAQLEYSAFDSDGNSILMPELGLKLRIDTGIPAPDLRERLLQTVIALTGIDTWEYDPEDGDLGGIRLGNVVAFVRLDNENPYIHIHARLLRDVEETHALLVRVNDLNSLIGHMHLFVKDNSVIAFSDILVSPFVSSIVAHGLGNFCQTANKLYAKLSAEFGEDAIGEDAIAEDATTTQPNHVVH